MMYSTFQRAQNVTSFAVSIAAALLASISLLSWLTIPVLEGGNIGVREFIIKEGTGFRSKNEYAMIRFDVQANLKPLFDNYNTKQLYVAITADYNNTKEGTTDSFVLWDRIITRQRPSDAVLRIEGAKPKYQWKAPKGTFKNIPATQFTLRYDIMPYIGILSSGIAGRARNPVFRAKNGSTTLTSQVADAGVGLDLGIWNIEVPKVRTGEV